MAGSLNHVVGGWSLIENLGDAYEAVEEMLYVILRCVDDADSIIREFRLMRNGDLPRDAAFNQTENAILRFGRRDDGREGGK